MTVTWQPLAAAIKHHNLHTNNGPHSITDAYGVTYTGSAAELTVLALARWDLSPDLALKLGGDVEHGTARWAARLLLSWFTPQDTSAAQDDLDYSRALRSRSSRYLLRCVALLANDAERVTLDACGPQTRHAYIRYLATEQLDTDTITDRPLLPDVTDYLSAAERSARNLTPAQAVRPDITITAAAPDGRVGVAFTVDAHTEIAWDDAEGVTYLDPAALNSLLCTPDGMRAHIRADEDLMDQVLDYGDSYTRGGGLEVEVQRFGPAPAEPPPVDRPQPQPQPQVPAEGSALEQGVQCWLHPDPTCRTLRLVYDGGEGGIYEIGPDSAELVEVEDGAVPSDWVPLTPATQNTTEGRAAERFLAWLLGPDTPYLLARAQGDAPFMAPAYPDIQELLAQWQGADPTALDAEKAARTDRPAPPDADQAADKPGD